MSSEPIPLKLSDSSAARIIRDIARQSERVFVSPHAKLRMKQRKITLPQVFQCLSKGVITESVHRNSHGDWQCDLSTRYAGDLITVGVVLNRDERGNFLIVATVIKG